MSDPITTDEMKMMAEAAAGKLRAEIVAGFKSLALKVGKTAAYLIVAAALVFLGHVL